MNCLLDAYDSHSVLKSQLDFQPQVQQNWWNKCGKLLFRTLFPANTGHRAELAVPVDASSRPTIKSSELGKFCSSVT